MALNVGNIVASLQLNIKDFNKSMRDAQSVLQKAFGPQTQHGIKKTKEELSSTALGLRDVERIVGGIVVSQAFYRMASQIQLASASLFSFMNDMEKAQIAMEYFLGSAEKSSAFIYNMKDFAATTAFNTQQALTLSRRLMAAQFDPSKVRGVMEILNDASAASGGTAEQMDRIVLALSQIKTNGKVAGQEMRQLAEAGIPIYRILQEELGLTGEELMRIGELKISGDLGVKAVLSGLEKRYKGAAARIANTMAGMWETIKDNSLMIGEELSAYPYKLMEKNVRRVRDAMESARKTLADGGIGALFEKMFSPKIQGYIRTILASIKSMIQSFGILAKTIGPSVAYVMERLSAGFSMILPPLAALIRGFSTGLYVIFELIPPMKYLAATILSLSIAATVAKLLMVLWRVTGIGLICATVAKAVSSLATAVKGLYAVILVGATPTVLAIMAVVAALALLGAKYGVFDRISAGFKRIMGSAMGVDANAILQPDKANNKSFLDKFNDKAVETGKNLKDLTKKAKDAGKKMKDAFESSFDELYQVPEELDETGDSLGDLADNTSGLDLGVGRIETPDLSLGGAGISMPEINTDALVGGLDLSWRGIGKWAIDTYNKFNQWSLDTGKAIWDWSVNTLKSFGSWAADTAIAIWDWSVDTYKKFNDWSIDTYRAFSDWSIDTAKAIGSWIVDTFNGFIGWTIDSAVAFDKWFKVTSFKIGTWVADGITKIGDWSKVTGAEVLTWTVGTALKISTWVSDTKDDFVKWSKDTYSGFNQWSIDTVSSIATWSTDTYNKFNQWSIDTVSAISTWISGTYSAFNKWNVDTVGNISSWAVSAYGEFNEWSIDTIDLMVDWAQEVPDKLGTACDVIMLTFKVMASTVKSYFGNLWDDIRGILNSIIKGVNTMTSAISNIKIRIPKVKIPLGPTLGGGTIGMPQIPQIPQLERGGIVLRDQLVRMGEKNHREAVVPLENPAYMKPFSDAVASQLVQILGNGQGHGTSSSSDARQIMYVGTLVADDRGLKELERKLNVIRMNEQMRGASR